MKPHRVLYINTPNYIGGAEVSILTLMEHLNRSCYQPYLLTSGDGTLTLRSRELSIPTYVQSFPWFSRSRPWIFGISILRIVKIIRNNQIDLIHTNCDHSLPYVSYASRATGVPYVSHIRDFVRTWFQADKISIMNKATHVIASSNALARTCINEGVMERKVVVIYNPVDIELFHSTSSSAAAQLREEEGIPQKALVIGIVGQIQPAKGHIEFFEAALRLLKQLTDVHFLIVGSAHGESNLVFLEQLRFHVLNSKYADNFHFLGFRRDIASVMKAIDILALPSYTEAFGRVVVEGMAAGCAIICTDVGGVPEIVSDEIDGLMIPPKDVDALYHGLLRLCLESQLRQQLISVGYSAAERFSIGNHVNQVESLYSHIFSKS